MPRELPTDLLGNKMTFRNEKNEATRYAQQNKRKPWCFPFRDALERAGWTVANGKLKRIT